MSKLGKITLLATAAEAARQWARNNPDKASGYIDKAGQTVNRKTGGKYTKQVTGATAKAKDAVAKGANQPRSGSTPPPPQPGA